MASAGHQEDAGPDGERCASSAIASESDTDYSWGWLDSTPVTQLSQLYRAEKRGTKLA